MIAIVYGTENDYIKELKKENKITFIQWLEGTDSEFIQKLDECKQIICLTDETNFGKNTIHPRLYLIHHRFSGKKLNYMFKENLKQIILN